MRHLPRGPLRHRDRFTLERHSAFVDGRERCLGWTKWATTPASWLSWLKRGHGVVDLDRGGIEELS
jgi:hypothetical protein